MRELLVSTRKGLFGLVGDPRSGFELRARAFAGEPVEFALRDRRSGRLLAATTSPFYGPKIFLAEDLAADWEQARGVELPAGGEQALERIWVIAPGEADGLLYAGGDPGVLFESADRGATWEINAGLWQQESRTSWQPGGAGLCLHSIATWPGDPGRLSVAISAAGVWHSEDGGRSWQRRNKGLTPRYLPEDVREQLRLPEPPRGVEPPLCVHHLERARARPERLFIQFHGGVYRSDDGGASWIAIGSGLPSDFGFPLVVDPADPDCAYVIPLVADMDRVTPEGRVRVYETRDAGASWRPRGEGLPQEHAYVTVLRQAFAAAGEGERLELYFGTTSGEVFGSADGGATWATVAARLPPVLAITAG
jgi:photosystem II stability/assembly factor-like uncharacterized protein